MKYSYLLTAIFLLLLAFLVWQRVANWGIWAGFILSWSLVEWSGWKYKRLSLLGEAVYWLVLVMLIYCILTFIPYLNNSV